MKKSFLSVASMLINDLENITTGQRKPPQLPVSHPLSQIQSPPILPKPPSQPRRPNPAVPKEKLVKDVGKGGICEDHINMYGLDDIGRPSFV